MTLYESRMRELYPDKYKDKIFNEELMKWEPKKKHLLKRELKKKHPRKTNPDARAKAHGDEPIVKLMQSRLVS